METNVYPKIAVNLSPMLNALSHPARLLIMLHLVKYNGCQAGSISGRLPLAKSTVSEHLNKLKEAGLITCILDGTLSNYQISEDGFKMLQSYFTEFIKLMEQHRAEPQKCCPIVRKKEKGNVNVLA
jgi:DNA-binding transcriptional ArsR family regulator